MLISKGKVEELKRLYKNNMETYCSGLFLSAKWFIVSQFEYNGLNFIILPDKDSAEYCANDLYNLTEGDRVFYFPDSAVNLQKSNFKATVSVQRTSTISKILSYKKEDGPLYIVSYPEAIAEGIPDIEKKSEVIISFKVGDEISHEKISEILTEKGFERVDFVSVPGQFAIRGGIADIFSFGFNYPYRISFFGNEVDKIHVFDANSQLSVSEENNVDIIRNLSTDSSEINTRSLLSIFPKDTLIWLDSSQMYREESFFNETENFLKIYLDVPLDKNVEDKTVKFNINPQPIFNKSFDILCEDIRSKYTGGYKVYVYVDKRSQADRMRSIIIESGGIIPEFIEGKIIHQGFIDKDEKICCYSEHEIFERFHRATLRRSVERTQQLTVNDLAAFNIGDYIVHIDLGIGIFGGLVRVKDDKGRYHEVVKLQYKDSDVVFVSVHALHKISKYRGRDGEPPKINKLGSKTWQNLKNTTKSKVKDIAKELIQLYAKRKASNGFAFSPDGFLQNELESSFEWEDTPDQEKATEAIKRDMEDNCPMDRLICGDVGFGKTELAVRAAFKAVCDGKQVAVLVPTTILCLQHFNTFTSRLKGMPCSVNFVSRLKTTKEITEIKDNLKKGKIDIIIGTHKLLGEGFSFKDLGLLIIDEEQKFGVSAKEKLRQLKMNVDTLTLTATPIPRTLQFSLLGARDLSILNTPPPNRVPVQTEIILFNKDEIKSIINYELQRGGQIFFVNNRVEELDSIRDILQRLVPEMSICVAHGQMESKSLEDKILNFMAGEYDMLLCTTIIENGLDIPNANTIIINQAQNIGLSDLHQLRGRVGRSKRKGFCYLIVPPLASVTDDARKRLEAIEAFSDLGSGFNIAMRDLDIRGAGNLLGAQQSGFISDIGMETYQKILSEAMEELGIDIEDDNQTVHNENYVTDCTVDTDIMAMIPDDYIDIMAEKVRIYKELDSAGDDKNLMRLRVNLEDRFGHIPEELDALMDIVRIRSLGRQIGFEKIIIKNGLLICFFITNPMSSFFRSPKFGKIMDAVATNASVFELKQKDGSLRVLSRGVDSSVKAYELLKKLSN